MDKVTADIKEQIDSNKVLVFMKRFTLPTSVCGFHQGCTECCFLMTLNSVISMCWNFQK